MPFDLNDDVGLLSGQTGHSFSVSGERPFTFWPVELIYDTTRGSLDSRCGTDSPFSNATCRNNERSPSPSVRSSVHQCHCPRFAAAAKSKSPPLPSARDATNTSSLSIQLDQDHRALSQVRLWQRRRAELLRRITNRSSLRHALRLSPSLVRPPWAYRPSIRPGTAAQPWSVRVRTPPLLQIITRDFLTISAPSSACDVGACDARRGGAARDHRHHLLNGKKQTWPPSIGSENAISGHQVQLLARFFISFYCCGPVLMSGQVRFCTSNAELGIGIRDEWHVVNVTENPSWGESKPRELLRRAIQTTEISLRAEVVSKRGGGGGGRGRRESALMTILVPRYRHARVRQEPR